MDIFIEDIFESTKQEPYNVFYGLVFKYPSHDISGYLLSLWQRKPWRLKWHRLETYNIQVSRVFSVNKLRPHQFRLFLSWTKGFNNFPCRCFNESPLRLWGTREDEPIFKEQGNKTVKIRGQKHLDIRNKARYFWDFIYGRLCTTVISFVYLTQEITFFFLDLFVCVLRG